MTESKMSNNWRAPFDSFPAVEPGTLAWHRAVQDSIAAFRAAGTWARSLRQDADDEDSINDAEIIAARRREQE
jgi:hypothetical protein